MSEDKTEQCTDEEYGTIIETLRELRAQFVDRNRRGDVTSYGKSISMRISNLTSITMIDSLIEHLSPAPEKEEPREKKLTKCSKCGENTFDWDVRGPIEISVCDGAYRRTIADFEYAACPCGHKLFNLDQWSRNLRARYDFLLELVEKLHAENRAAVEALQIALEALKLYANPESYRAIAIVSDRPAGAFADDFSEVDHPHYDRAMPGKKAREAMEEISRLGDELGTKLKEQS